MSDATYTFLPWARRGLAAGLGDAADVSAPPPRRQRLPVTLRVETDAGDRDVTVGQPPGGGTGPGLRLFGPGDVLALDPRAVTRVEPPPGSSTFKPNDLPLVEFARPDLPWLFTPAGPDPQERVLPWLCLVCVRDDGDAELVPRRNGLPVLTADAAQLPDPAEAWAWAHVQVAGTMAGAADLGDLYRDHPERVTSRLLCPRNLEPGTRYLACLVPLFEEGRLAGLGEPVPEADGDLSFAWAAGGRVRLPVYHHWRFGTGFEGDFESLARLLEARPSDELGGGVGRRPVDVQAPGFRVPRRTVIVRPPRVFASAPPRPDPGGAALAVAQLPPFPVRLDPYVRSVPVEGALRVPGVARDGQHGWLTARVGALVSQTTDADGRPVVAPPVYGRWHVGEDGLPDAGAAPPWLRELNVDLRHRVAAGVGAAVVRDQQENLMAAAWDQVGEVLRINQLLRQAQLSRQASGALYARDLLAPARCAGAPGPGECPESLGVDLLLRMTSPVHGRVRLGSGETVRAAFEGSLVPPAALSPAFRRATRVRGPVRRRASDAGKRARPQPADVVGGFCRGELSGAPEASVPDGAVVWGEDLDLPGELDLAGALDGLLPTDALPEPARPDVAGALAALCRALDPENAVCRRVHGRLPAEVEALLWAGDGPCSLEPILAAPDFPRPMYLELKERSQEWVLPGLAEVPRNTVTLLETNPEFVESYLAGLNHEMAAELLWREFPTDQRGTPFRQFWDKRGALGTGDPAFDPDDVDRMHTWQGRLGEHLRRGGAGQLVLLVRGDLLQLFPNTLVYATRAVWDGNRRRPIRNTATSNGPDEPPTPPERVLFDEAGARHRPNDAVRRELYPVFRGTLEPDVTFLGFDLDPETAAVAADPTTGAPGAGWFVVLQGPPVEPRFGLDETLDFAKVGRSGAELRADDSNVQEPWSDVAWGDLVKDAGSAEANEARLDALAHIAVAPSAPELNSLNGVDMAGVRWGWNAAHMAHITLQLPVRLALHADDMLP